MARATQDITIWDESDDYSVVVDVDGKILLPTGASTETTLDAFKTENDTNLNAIETNQTDGTQRTQLTDGTNDVTVTNDRLDVNAAIGSIPSVGSPTRVETPIHENDGFDNDRTKISYTVPSGKVLYVQTLWGAYESDASGHTVSFRVDGTAFLYMEFNNDATTSNSHYFPDSNPYILTAGDVLTAYRQEGSSPESWGAGFDGYLEDA